MILFGFWLRLASCVMAQPKPSHIVVFLADDHGQLDSEPYGATAVRTPNMAQLARDGLKFTHALIASPVCAPSRTLSDPAATRPTNLDEPQK